MITFRFRIDLSNRPFRFRPGRIAEQPAKLSPPPGALKTCHRSNFPRSEPICPMHYLHISRRPERIQHGRRHIGRLQFRKRCICGRRPEHAQEVGVHHARTDALLCVHSSNSTTQKIYENYNKKKRSSVRACGIFLHASIAHRHFDVDPVELQFLSHRLHQC